MFAQLCADLPWTQQLSEVWRMHDPAERAASLALRDGEPEPMRARSTGTATRTGCTAGTQITMAADALDAYQADTDRGGMRCWSATPPRWPTR